MEQWWDLEFLTHQDKLLEASRPSFRHETSANHTNAEAAENKSKHTQIQKKQRTMSGILRQREGLNDQINGRGTGEQTKESHFFSSAAHKNRYLTLSALLALGRTPSVPVPQVRLKLPRGPVPASTNTATSLSLRNHKARRR